MINEPLATSPVSITFPLNQSGSQLATIENNQNSRLDTDEQNISANTLNITSNTNAITALQTDNTTNKNNISTLQSQMTTANTNITNLQTAVNTLQSQMNTANTNIGNNTSAITALQGRMTTAETNITNNTNAIASINSQLTTINNTLTSLQNQINTINTTLTDLQNQINTNATNIASIQSHDNTQDQSIADLNTRVTALETGGPSPAQSGPFIGDIVHIIDRNGHHQPAIVYEDWDGKNANGLVSVAVLSPIRLSESPWDSFIEVERDHLNAPPYSTWHWPEASFTYRRNLYGRIAARAG